MSRQFSRPSGPPAAVAAFVVSAAALGIATASPALAAYPPAAPQCSLATSTNTSGAPVTVSGVGFPAGGVVTVGGSGSAVLPVRSARAGADGTLRVVERLGQPGAAVFTLSGTSTNTRCGAVSVAPHVLPTSAVTSPPAPPAAVAPAQATKPLAFTGAEHVGLAALVGAGLLGGGAGLVLVGRRRARA